MSIDIVKSIFMHLYQMKLVNHIYVMSFWVWGHAISYILYLMYSLTNDTDQQLLGYGWWYLSTSKEP